MRLALLTFILGMVLCRYGQHKVMDNFQACVDAKEVHSMEDFFRNQQACMPSKIAQKIFFW